MTISSWLVFASWVVFVGYWLVSASRAKKSTRRLSWPAEVALRLVILLAIVISFRIPGLDRFFRSLWRRGALPGIAGEILGATLCLIGIGSAIWARASLGRNWGPPMSINESPELVTAGPYAYVRHPIYASLWFAMLGSAVAQSAWWLIPLVFGSPYFFYSARAEENTMLERFPDEYRVYMTRTKMFVPFVL